VQKVYPALQGRRYDPGLQEARTFVLEQLFMDFYSRNISMVFFASIPHSPTYWSELSRTERKACAVVGGRSERCLDRKNVGIEQISLSECAFWYSTGRVCRQDGHQRAPCDRVRFVLTLSICVEHFKVSSRSYHVTVQMHISSLRIE
jgi:hypothetical protein